MHANQGQEGRRTDVHKLGHQKEGGTSKGADEDEDKGKGKDKGEDEDGRQGNRRHGNKGDRRWWG